MKPLRELMALCGKGRFITSDRWFVEVEILDVRAMYGRIDVLCKQSVKAGDKAGDVEQWVSAERLRLLPKPLAELLR